MEISEYHIIGRDSSRALAEEVNEMILGGWQPYGSLSVQQLVVEDGFKGEGYQFYFNQVMVRFSYSKQNTIQTEANEQNSEGNDVT